MKYFVVAVFLFIGFWSYGQTDSLTAYDEMLSEYYERTVPFIHPQELYNKMKSGETVYLLDTREGREYAVSALDGAEHVGFLFFSKKRVRQYSRDDLLVVYCTIGARSENIGEQLIKNGFTNVYNLYGGIIHWKNSGFPVYKNGVKTEEVHVYSKKWGKWLTKGKSRY